MGEGVGREERGWRLGRTDKCLFQFAVGGFFSQGLTETACTCFGSTLWSPKFP